MKPTFEPIADGLEVIDPIERHRYRLTTHESVTPTPVDCDRLAYPIDSAVAVTTEMLTLPTRDTIYVHEEDGSMCAVQPHEQRLFPEGTYVLDLSISLKLYVRVDSSVHIYSDSERTYIAFGKSTRTILGARSYHTRPAETITTTAEPTDVMQAVSTFGSALKTMRADRSYPTLRGHPPALKLGEELSVPETISPSDSAVRIEIPPTLRQIFVVTPLAYYLGAAIVPGPVPRLVTEDGYTHSFDSTNGFESAVERVLKQVFFLDCIVRTEGPSQLSLHERDAVEPVLGSAVETLQDQSLSAQLEAYLEIPYTDVQPHLPEWQLEMNVPATTDIIEFLPFIADDLAIVTIETTTQRPTPVSETHSQAIEEFTRSDFVRSGRSRNSGALSVTQPTVQTVQQRWTGTSSSSITSTTPLSAFHHSIERTPRDDPITIDVICNDQEMQEELETVNGVYGAQEDLPFDVRIHDDLSTDELRDTLARKTDFCHYIGHIDADGIQCSDGKLDAASLDTVGAKAFLLNACQSHNQGLQLIEAGSIGGIVTLGDVVNDGAVSVGSTIARLLNHGFPLYAALDIARGENVVGEQYRLVGDGLTTIAKSNRQTPILYVVSRTETDVRIRLTMYPAERMAKGALFIPELECFDSHRLLPGETGWKSLTNSQFADFLEGEPRPIVVDGDLCWSSQMTPS